MPLAIHTGVSGIGTTRNATYGRVITRDARYVPGGVVLQGSKWYDNGNTGSVRTIRPGHIGKLSSNKIVPAVFGPTTVAYVSGETSLTVSATTALAIYQALGSSGTLYLLGGLLAPTTTALVLATAVTFSAINTSTGVLTIADLGANRAAGGMLLSFQPALLGGTGGLTHPNIGLGIIDRHEGVKATDYDGNDQDCDLAEFATGGLVDCDQLPVWPSNEFIQQVLAHNLTLANPQLSFNNQWV
jgi:hypothetical protein